MFMPASGSSTRRSASRTASSSGAVVIGLARVRARLWLAEPPHERQPLRRREADVVEESEQPEIARRDDGLDALDAQRAEVREQLRQQRAADAAVREAGSTPMVSITATGSVRPKSPRSARARLPEKGDPQGGA